MKNKIIKIIIDLTIGILYLKLMNLIYKLDSYSLIVGSGLILLWDCIDKIRGEKNE